MSPGVLAQASAQTTATDSSSAAAVVFGVLVLVGVLSLFAMTVWGRRTLGPLVAILIGASILATTIHDAWSANVSPLTFIGLFFGLLMVVPGFGALREGTAVPHVEGVEPDPRGRTVDVTQKDV